MARSGEFVARFVDPCDPQQVQPNGVDLRAGELFRIDGSGAIGDAGTQLAPRRPVPWTAEEPLAPGAYVVRYLERVRIPAGHVGVVYPRSSLLRNGAMLFSALWDQGYEGRGEALLVLWHPLRLPPGARIGQLVLFTAETAAGYHGQWQHEGL